MDVKTVKEGLELLYQINRVDTHITADGMSMTHKDIQRMTRDVILGLCELLGIEDVFLKD